MEQPALPTEVCEALDRIKKCWGRYLTQNDLNALLLNINIVGTSGDSLILKKFAANNPTDYIKALANGYKPKQENINEEVCDIIQHWMNTPYVGNEAKDVRNFAEKLTEFYKQKLSKTS